MSYHLLKIVAKLDKMPDEAFLKKYNFDMAIKRDNTYFNCDNNKILLFSKIHGEKEYNNPNFALYLLEKTIKNDMIRYDGNHVPETSDYNDAQWNIMKELHTVKCTLHITEAFGTHNYVSVHLLEIKELGVFIEIFEDIYDEPTGESKTAYALEQAYADIKADLPIMNRITDTYCDML